MESQIQEEQIEIEKNGRIEFWLHLIRNNAVAVNKYKAGRREGTLECADDGRVLLIQIDAGKGGMVHGLPSWTGVAVLWVG